MSKTNKCVINGYLRVKLIVYFYFLTLVRLTLSYGLLLFYSKLSVYWQKWNTHAQVYYLIILFLNLIYKYFKVPNIF